MSIVSKRIGSARFFADELSVILGTISVRSSVCEQRPAFVGIVEILRIWGGERNCLLVGKKEMRLAASCILRNN